METDRYTNELIQLGKRIKFFREKLKLTQQHVDVMSGVSNADISRIENGQKNIEFHTIVKLAIALNVELEDLFRKEKKPE
jgi:transcriptional regulator with XRE-family HTH domain